MRCSAALMAIWCLLVANVVHMQKLCETWAQWFESTLAICMSICVQQDQITDSAECLKRPHFVHLQNETIYIYIYIFRTR